MRREEYFSRGDATAQRKRRDVAPLREKIYS